MERQECVSEGGGGGGGGGGSGLINIQSLAKVFKAKLAEVIVQLYFYFVGFYKLSQFFLCGWRGLYRYKHTLDIYWQA